VPPPESLPAESRPAADFAASLKARRGSSPYQLGEARPLALRPVPPAVGEARRSYMFPPVPSARAPLPAPAASSGTAGQPERPHWPRWSADGWALVRRGQSAPALAAGAAAYGGSQAGAVLRYNLAPASAHLPRVYVRAAAALAAPVRQSEGALGLMVRPVPRLPFSVMGEVRAQDNGGQFRTRPVITAVSELPPIRLPMDAEAEVYAQAGWAGGRGATVFYDMAAVAQRCVAAPASGVQLRLGGGLWSGGQRGAARLDLGPRLEMRGMLGPETRRIGVRLAVDWRFRVAGGAEPGSGPALTLATGF
jgi:hypothetical protein